MRFPAVVATRLEDLSGFGELLRDARGEHTLAEMVDLLRRRGVETTTAQVYAWENGKRAPSTRESASALDAAIHAEGELLARLGHLPEEPPTPVELLERRVAALEAAMTMLLGDFAPSNGH